MSRYIDILLAGKNALKKAEIQDWNTDAWLLFEHVFGMDRGGYFMRQLDECEDFETEEKYMNMIKTRCRHIPLQHITGHQEFMGFDFLVNEHTLIPRQDTEVLVEKVLECIRDMAEKVSEDNSGMSESTLKCTNGVEEKESEDISGMTVRKCRKEIPCINILDMCTGTGCIAISAAKLAQKYMEDKIGDKKVMGKSDKDISVNVTGADVSAEALKLAEENKRRLRADNVSLIESNLFDNIKENRWDIIVSNPPYIRTKDIDELEDEVKLHDPRLALDGMEDGLFFYRKITEAASHKLKEDGFLLYEIGFDQAADVSEIMKKNGFTDIKVVKDMAGLDRVVTGKLHH